MISKNLLIIGMIVLMLSGVCMADQTTSVYLIRHAEKNLTVDKDPELTAEGRARAENWAEVFQRVSFDAVYSTDTKRTQTTALPIAESQNLAVESYPPFDVNLDDLLKKHAGQTVLLVGHSNTIPILANKLLQETRYVEMDEDDYASLFIVTLTNDAQQSQWLSVQ